MQTKVPHLPRFIILKNESLQSISYLLNANDFVSLMKVEEAELLLLYLDLDKLTVLLIEGSRYFSLIVDAVLGDVTIYYEVSIG